MFASLILVAVVAFLAAGLTLFSGFGLGTLLLPAFAVFGWPIEVAVAATALVHLANNLFKLGLLGRHARRDVVARFGVPAVVASFAGAALLVRLPAEGARVTIGALILVFAALELWPRFQTIAFPPRALPLGGALSGFVGGLSGHQGALRTAFLVRLRLTREQFLGTGIACAVLVDVARLLVYGGEHWRSGFAHVAAIWPAVAAGTLAAFTGSWLGARLAHKVTMPAIRLLVGVLLAVLGVAIMAGLGAAPPPVVRSTAGTTTAEHGWAVNYPKQRKLFALHGRLWLFYADGRDVVLRTSADGASWSEPAVVVPGLPVGHGIGLCCDGTFLHYAACTGLPGAPVRYRRGRPDARGTVEWAAEQVALAVAPGHAAKYPKVVVDGSGRPWVAFVACRGGGQLPPYDAVVTRSALDDGTWRTAPDFPVELARDVREALPDLAGAALAGGATYWLVNARPGRPFEGRCWDGGAWREPELLGDGACPHPLFDVAAAGGDVHAVWLAAGGLRWSRRDARGAWQAAEVVHDGGSGHAGLTVGADGGAWVGWLDEGGRRVLARERRTGGWSAPRVLAEEAAAFAGGPQTRGINVNVLAEPGAGWRFALVYATGETPPFALRFAGRR